MKPLRLTRTEPAERGAGWFRLWRHGPGFSWTREAPLFSERMGYRKPFMVIATWRFKWLRSWK